MNGAGIGMGMGLGTLTLSHLRRTRVVRLLDGFASIGEDVGVALPTIVGWRGGVMRTHQKRLPRVWDSGVCSRGGCLFMVV